MSKKIKILYLAAILPVLLLGACKKDGTPVISKIKAIKNEFKITGFVLGDTIEQFFDGVKMRDYYSRVRKRTTRDDQLAFTTDEIKMELRKKSTGEIVYSQTFNINDKQYVVPNFYFDGLKFSNSYAYPDPQGNEYTVNFYLDPHAGSAAVDINIDVLEYYYDSTKPDPIIVVNTTTIPIAQNVQPGKWTSYMKVQIPVATPQQTGTELYPIVVVRDAKTKEYYVNNRDYSTINLELPYDGGSPGKVQSIFLNKIPGVGKSFFLDYHDLVQLFPR